MKKSELADKLNAHPLFSNLFITENIIDELKIDPSKYSKFSPTLVLQLKLKLNQNSIVQQKARGIRLVYNITNRFYYEILDKSDFVKTEVGRKILILTLCPSFQKFIFQMRNDYSIPEGGFTTDLNSVESTDNSAELQGYKQAEFMDRNPGVMKIIDDYKTKCNLDRSFETSIIILNIILFSHPIALWFTGHNEIFFLNQQERGEQITSTSASHYCLCFSAYNTKRELVNYINKNFNSFKKAHFQEQTKGQIRASTKYARDYFIYIFHLLGYPPKTIRSIIIKKMDERVSLNTISAVISKVRKKINHFEQMTCDL